jgi:hypothetical protein
MESKANAVLVHGAGADGSSWSRVIRVLALPVCRKTRRRGFLIHLPFERRSSGAHPGFHSVGDRCGLRSAWVAYACVSAVAQEADDASRIAALSGSKPNSERYA